MKYDRIYYQQCTKYTVILYCTNLDLMHGLMTINAAVKHEFKLLNNKKILKNFKKYIKKVAKYCRAFSYSILHPIFLS